MLGHRLRRWPNIRLILVQRLVFARMYMTNIAHSVILIANHIKTQRELTGEMI